MEKCRQCHEDIYQSFIQTGMGQSWDYATHNKSAAHFDSHSVIYDKYKDFYYKPYWRNDSLYIMEYRMEGRDTTYKHSVRVKYIVGSGQHTNSHIWEVNGYLYQVPMTFYTQKAIWDLPPGFEDGDNSRFSRIISLECMGCHNAYPHYDFTAENKFLMVKTGIDCERCHGPGEIHVREKSLGHFVDTSKFIDYTIVNPKKLPRDLQVNLCQRCHLQGISVINEGKTIFDWKPAMMDSEIMNVFMPRYENDNNGKFIMASHADRMKMSQCYIQSGTMTCLTCHNPHVSVKFSPVGHFNNVCSSCHSTNTHNELCTAPMADRLAKKDNCVECHMPMSETMDIPHVMVHDHWIKKPVVYADKNKIQKFIGLKCLTTDHPSDLLKAEGYLEFYDAYVANPQLLDSIQFYLARVTDSTSTRAINAWIYFYYLKNDFTKITCIAAKMGDCIDPYTIYRIGDAYYNLNDYKNALVYINRALKLRPAELLFKTRQGDIYVMMNDMKSASQAYSDVLTWNPDYAMAYCNLGYVKFMMGDYDVAKKNYDMALALDPDYTQALFNEAQLFLVRQNKNAAVDAIKKILKHDPGNIKAQTIMQQLSGTI
jgi:Flp pilus assembly protein TadD